MLKLANLLFKSGHKKGFTLSEILIVVAIIAVLVIVSIPIFSTHLEKSREETDLANLRAAKAAAVTRYTDNNESGCTCWYDAEQGVLIYDSDEAKALADNGGYGEGFEKVGGCEDFKLSTRSGDATYYRVTDNVKNKIIEVKILNTDNALDGITLSWVNSSEVTTSGDSGGGGTSGGGSEGGSSGGSSGGGSSSGGSSGGSGEEKTGVTISYYPNEGTGSIEPQSKEAGVSVTLSDGTGFTAPSGKSFKEWNTAADGTGTVYAAGATYTEDVGLELYAQWKETGAVPVLRVGSSWRDEVSYYITDIYNVYFYDDDSNAPEPDSCSRIWDASEAGDGSIMAYLTDSDRTIVITGNGSGSIKANPDSSYVFEDFSAATIHGLELLDTSDVTTMEGMFYKTGLYVDVNIFPLEGWDVSNVTNMNVMFYQCGYRGTTNDMGTDFIVNTTGWDTSNVESMTGMFNYTKGADVYEIIGISDWDVSNVKNLALLFEYAEAKCPVNLDFSKWDTSNIDSISYAFGHAFTAAETLNIDVSGWDSSNFTYMNDSFEYCGTGAGTVSIKIPASNPKTGINNSSVYFYGHDTSVQAFYAYTSWTSGKDLRFTLVS